MKGIFQLLPLRLPVAPLSVFIAGMKWISAILLMMTLMGCAHSFKEAGAVQARPITNLRASEIAAEAAMNRRWSDQIFTTPERTKEGWRVFVEEASGRKRKAFVLIGESGEVIAFRAVRE